MSPKRVSFHDPDGSVYFHGNAVWRALEPAAARRLAAFLCTEVAGELARQGDIPKTLAARRDLEWTSMVSGTNVWFEHERVPFVNYPHEWIPEQLASACSFTLRLSTKLRSVGWDLKDGNSRNVLFDGIRPVFVDFGSFEERSDLAPVWYPSGQVQRHFLLPLMAYRHLKLSPNLLLLGRPDGLSHEEAFECLKHYRWTDRHAIWLCTLPTLLSRYSNAAAALSIPVQDKKFCRLAVDRTIESLLTRCESILEGLPSPRSRWADYETSRPHYSETQVHIKNKILEQLLRRLKPKNVLDVGTNGGEYANLAARFGAQVVSIDSDLEALRVAHRSAVKDNLAVLHLNVDFSAPTPALGWGGSECLSFDQRAQGRFDLVLALAVFHHILVGGRIPLQELLSRLAEFTSANLVIEYVDPSDTMFASLAKERRSDFAHLNQDFFECQLRGYFSDVESFEIIPGRRVLYLCSKKFV